MSPIIDLQLRLRQLGTLRMGELTTRNGKTYPSSRETWRVTTSDDKIAAQIAGLFGGTPAEWDSKSAERLVVDTDADSLPIAVVPGHALSQYWESWSGGGCKRRCDGHEELISGGPCLCDPEARECKPTTRLSVVIRGVDALGLFRLNTGGYYAAVELGGAAQFLETRTARGEVLEGWLRIEERKVVRGGQTKVFKVPTLDVAYGIDRMLPAGETPAALPAPTYTPLTSIESVGVSVAEGLAIAASQTVTRTARSAAPIPPADDVEFGGPVSVPDDTPPATSAAEPAFTGSPNGGEEARQSPESAAETPAASHEKPATKAQHGKANLLVGQLRDQGRITTEQLWAACAKLRQIDVDTMIEVLDGRDGGGVLHWSPLRDSLTRGEASNLIDRLEKLETGAAA